MVELTLHACIKSDADDKEVIEILKDFEIVKPVKPFSVVHKDKSSIYPNNFVIDWQAGYDAAKENISDFAHDHIEKKNGKLKDDWDAGYFAGMMDIIEFIERMGTDERN